MARQAARFVCQNCGSVTNRWSGRCEGCGEWNTIEEEAATADIMTVATGKASRARGRRLKLTALDEPIAEAPRIETGIGEFDRVTGGGIVPGSAILIGGDPGIGKSTLLLQAAAALARAGRGVVYVTGEEATAQVQLRARRLGADSAPVALAAETSVESILETLQAGPTPTLVVIDSIQTLHTSIAEAAPRHRHPGPLVRSGADPLRQAFGRSGHPGRTRHQGRPARRPARRGSTWSTRC